MEDPSLKQLRTQTVRLGDDGIARVVMFFINEREALEWLKSYVE